MEIEYLIRKADLCKSVIDKERPFEGNLLKQVQEFYRLDTTWSSNAIEGNSLTIGETKIILEDGITVGGKPLKEILEACGHAEAYDYMMSLMRKENIDLSDILKMHQILMQKVDPDYAGKYKTENNLITGSRFSTTPVENVEKEMEELVKWNERKRKSLHPIIFASEFHRKIVYIHPFKDGNGRTARLLMNTILIQNGYLPCVISPVIRLDYINALEAGHNEEKKTLFLKVIAEAIIETEKDFIRNMNLKMPDFHSLNDEKRTEQNQSEKNFDYLIYKRYNRVQGLYDKDNNFVAYKTGSKAEMEKQFGCKIKDPYDLLKGKNR